MPTTYVFPGSILTRMGAVVAAVAVASVVVAAHLMLSALPIPH